MSTRLRCFRMLRWGGWRQVDDKWMWGNVELNDWERRIYEKFGECFGVRKNCLCGCMYIEIKNLKSFIIFFQKRDLPLSNLTNIEVPLNLLLSPVIFSVCLSSPVLFCLLFFPSAFLHLLSTQKAGIYCPILQMRTARLWMAYATPTCLQWSAARLGSEPRQADCRVPALNHSPTDSPLIVVFLFKMWSKHGHSVKIRQSWVTSLC